MWPTLVALCALGAQPPGTVGPEGGTVAALNFAVIGDCRPSDLDDTANYPVAVVKHILQDIETASPRPQLILATGDYMNADPRKPPATNQAARQMGIFREAAKAFSGQIFPTLGNHECANNVSSNCCAGCHDGTPPNYLAFLDLLGQLGLPNAHPYYAARVSSSDALHPWTAKFVVIAANAWDEAQASWLEGELAAPTTYTFVTRHEPDDTPGGCLGCAASQEIVKRHPYTLLFVGHEHLFKIVPESKEVIVGNGGAPFYNDGEQYGYLLCKQRTDGAIACQEHDEIGSGSAYGARGSLVVNAAGQPVP